MLRLVSLPFCQVVMLDEWNAPPSRYFTAYLARGSSRGIVGHPVVDEFATLSSPIFLTPRPLLGKIYNAGISLGHLRDAEMALDLGWPPFCVGVDLPAPALPATWEQHLLQAVQGPVENDLAEEPMGSLTTASFPTHEVKRYQWADATVVVVSAALLPRQLERVCEVIKAPVAVAVAVGNRVERGENSKPRTVTAASESKLEKIVASVAGLE